MQNKSEAVSRPAYTPTQMRWLKIMYVVNILGAGLPGLATLWKPHMMARMMFGDEPQNAVVVRMLASVWLAVGGVSLLGLRHPMPFSALFPVQAAYKSVWLATHAPSLLQRRHRDVLPLALGFAAWVVGDLAVTPFSYLFERSDDVEKDACTHHKLDDKL